MTFCMVLSLFAIGAVPANADTEGYASTIVNGVLHMEAWVTPNATGIVEVDRVLQSSYTFTVTFKTKMWYTDSSRIFVGFQSNRQIPLCRYPTKIRDDPIFCLIFAQNAKKRLLPW